MCQKQINPSSKKEYTMSELEPDQIFGDLGHTCRKGKFRRGAQRKLSGVQRTHRAGRALYRCIFPKVIFSGEGDRYGVACYCHTGKTSYLGRWPIVRMYPSLDEARADALVDGKPCDAHCELRKDPAKHQVIELVSGGTETLKPSYDLSPTYSYRSDAKYPRTQKPEGICTLAIQTIHNCY
jgi:hypothetical protein